MDQKTKNDLDPSVDKHKRQWHPKDKKEQKIITKFLSLCNEKLTFSLMSSLKQEDIQRQIDMIYNEEVDLNYFSKLDTDEFYDQLVGQGRLFDE